MVTRHSIKRREPAWAILALATAVALSACERGPAQAAHAEDAPSDGAPSLLEKWCSSCHAPPRPDVHTAREWPAVVAQMQNHRIQQGLGKIDDQDLQTLLDYLQHHARPAS